MEDLAHADAYGSPGVRIGARRVEHERIELQGARRAGDDADVLRIVQSDEHGDPLRIGRGDLGDGGCGSSSGGGDHATVQVETDGGRQSGPVDDVDRCLVVEQVWVVGEQPFEA